MSWTVQTTIGTAVLGPALAVAAGIFLPEPPAITVHSLTYENGIVHQERTIIADAPAFHADWSARVQDQDGVTVCEGNGSWAYATGYAVFDIPIDDWVGDPGCLDRLSANHQYRLIAAWNWGDNQTSQVSEPFTP